MNIHIAIAEDNQKLSELLKEKIELNSDYKVVVMAENGKDLLDKLNDKQPIDVVFMDINMPIMNGIEASKKLIQTYPEIKIIISSIYDDEDHVFDAIIAGAVGYILKDAKKEEIHRAIEDVLNGNVPMSPEIARKALKLIKSGKPSVQVNDDYKLTAREVEILNHLSKGLQYDEIAGKLFISTGTVRKHIENIYKKLQVNNKVEAIQKFRFNLFF
mgnify:CR=1 FL=1